jgi:hypothetical protein
MRTTQETRIMNGTRSSIKKLDMMPIRPDDTTNTIKPAGSFRPLCGNIELAQYNDSKSAGTVIMKLKRQKTD